MKSIVLAAITSLSLGAACSKDGKSDEGNKATKETKTVTKPVNKPATVTKKKSLPPPPDVAAVPADAEKSASGLAWKVLKPGTGTDKPTATDTVQVHYTGWTTDGKMFDSSVVRGEKASFPLNRVVPGWTEGVQLMVVGEKRRFWVPGKLAYGDKPRRPGAPAGMLVFDIELFKINK